MLSAFFLRKNSNVNRMLLKTVVYCAVEPFGQFDGCAPIRDHRPGWSDGDGATVDDGAAHQRIGETGRGQQSDRIGGPFGPLRLRLGEHGSGRRCRQLPFSQRSGREASPDGLFAYNLRGDAGIGGTDIEVKPAMSLQGVQIQLRPLCQVRVQFVDAAGKPLQGITSGATWTKNGDGFWTEGTQSDKDGRAVLYLNAPEGFLQNVVSAFKSVAGSGEAQYVVDTAQVRPH